MDIEIAQNTILVVLVALIFFIYVTANALDELVEDMDKEGIENI